MIINLIKKWNRYANRYILNHCRRRHAAVWWSVLPGKCGVQTVDGGVNIYRLAVWCSRCETIRFSTYEQCPVCDFYYLPDAHNQRSCIGS